MTESEDCGVGAVFTDFAQHLAEECERKDELRVLVRELETVSREIHAVLMRVHRPGGILKASQVAAEANLKLEAVKQVTKQLDDKIPEGGYWKYCALWSSSLSWLSFLVCLAHYLESGGLLSRGEVTTLLALNTAKSLQLDIEEYLVGLCHLSNELARLSVNCVTSSDYSRPLSIADFLSSLNTGFRQLNLKNDHLRKKVDSIKYDLKKVEEVVYDLSIRGLASSTAPDKVVETESGAGDSSDGVKAGTGSSTQDIAQ